MVKVNWQVPILLHYNRGMQLSIAYIRVQIRKAKPLSLVFSLQSHAISTLCHFFKVMPFVLLNLYIIISQDNDISQIIMPFREHLREVKRRLATQYTSSTLGSNQCHFSVFFHPPRASIWIHLFAISLRLVLYCDLNKNWVKKNLKKFKI